MGNECSNILFRWCIPIVIPIVIVCCWFTMIRLIRLCSRMMRRRLIRRRMMWSAVVRMWSGIVTIACRHVRWTIIRTRRWFSMRIWSTRVLSMMWICSWSCVCWGSWMCKYTVWRCLAIVWTWRLRCRMMRRVACMERSHEWCLSRRCIRSIYWLSAIYRSWSMWIVVWCFACHLWQRMQLKMKWKKWINFDSFFYFVV